MKKLFLALAALCGFFISQNAHATCSNYTSYSDGQVLTASSLNSLQTNYTNCINDILDGNTFTGNVILNGGADLTINSDSGSTTVASIDGATGATIAGLTQAGQVTNCGMGISGSTFSITGYDGSALSATNPCVIAVKSNTAGRVALAYFTSNVTFTFGSSSDTDGNNFGVTSTADWSSVTPFFLGVIYDGTTPYFTISRLPLVRSDINPPCQKGDTTCDSDLDVMILATGLTLSHWESLPITQVGWFEMTYAASGNAWTATLSATDGTGFNSDYERKYFGFPKGQNGADSGSYLYAHGGTAPIFSSSSIVYQIGKNGMCTMSFYFDGDGGTDGSGSVGFQMAPIYSNPSALFVTESETWDTGSALIQLPSKTYQAVVTMTSRITFNVPNESGTALQNTYRNILNSDFSNGNRHINGRVSHYTWVNYN